MLRMAVNRSSWFHLVDGLFQAAELIQNFVEGRRIAEEHHLHILVILGQAFPGVRGRQQPERPGLGEVVARAGAK